MPENNTIRLRAPEPADLDALYLLENDTSLWQFGSTTTPLSRFALRDFIERCSEPVFDTRQLRLVIERKEDAQLIGTIDLYDFDPQHRRAGVGVCIDGRFQRQGYATGALEILKSYCFEILNLHQIYAFVPEKNLPSLSLFCRCGFVQTGVLTDWLIRRNVAENVVVLQYTDRA